MDVQIIISRVLMFQPAQAPQGFPELPELPVQQAEMEVLALLVVWKIYLTLEEQVEPEQMPEAMVQPQQVMTSQWQAVLLAQEDVVEAVVQAEMDLIVPQDVFLVRHLAAAQLQVSPEVLEETELPEQSVQPEL